MSELWYENPQVLFDEPFGIIPSDDLSRQEKANAIARLGIYLLMIIALLLPNKKYMALPIFLLIISFTMGKAEDFTSVNKELSKNQCQHPTRSNPFMNYTLGDLMATRERLPGCKTNEVKEEIKKKFRSSIITDSSDIWGAMINDRAFYTMPNTEIVNDQTSLARSCLGRSGNCKSYGKDCLKYRDPAYHRGRLSQID